MRGQLASVISNLLSLVSNLDVLVFMEPKLKPKKSLYEFSYDFQKSNMANQGFDPSTQCKASGQGEGQSAVVDQCCGATPNRFPFYSDNGNRACCNGKTYNSAALVCCSHGPAVAC